MLVTAKDIMSETVISVSPHDPLADAMELLLDRGVSGLPVVDDNGHLVGIISEADRIKPNADADSSEEPRVSDYMSRGVITVDENSTLDQIAELLVRASVRRLPVMRNGRVVGIVSRHDLVRALEANQAIFSD